ncbi:D-aminoacyl-tRNA deacylase [Hominifimenecus sp. rT4P-3]|uniref:D-aminoacyl-tRNA deacylase n=1 Tax=Hominifimenecus sp. rT4P-3 TaxID=3242979 RepID=UPI003DA35227
MKAVIQRVSRASVLVEDETIGSIDNGFLVLLGVGEEDTKEDVDRIVKKMAGLRIFADSEGKTNLSLKDVNGSLLVISQFTLYADCRKGNRPSFVHAAKPEMAEALYEYFVEVCRSYVPKVETGSFGAHMRVELVNDGPFTVLLE